MIVESFEMFTVIGFYPANKKAKCLADKHLAMYAEGVILDSCGAEINV